MNNLANIPMNFYPQNNNKNLDKITNKELYFLQPEDLVELNELILQLNQHKILFTDAYRFYLKEKEEKNRKELNNMLNALLKDIDKIEEELRAKFMAASKKVLPEGANIEDYDFDINYACFFKKENPNAVQK